MTNRFLSTLTVLLGCMAILDRAAAADSTAHIAAPWWKPVFSLHGGYASELWRLTERTGNAFGTANYNGTGGYLGCGIQTRASIRHPAGLGINVSYLAWSMQDELKKSEAAQTDYSFARLSPYVFLSLNPAAPVSVDIAGSLHFLSALKSYGSSYVQAGVHAAVRYEAYGAHIGYSLSPGGRGPNAATGDIRDRTLMIGLSFYPSRFRHWNKVKHFLKNA